MPIAGAESNRLGHAFLAAANPTRLASGDITFTDREEQNSSAVSLHETPMLLGYWDRVGGTLAEEFPAVRASAGVSPRRLDGVIVLGGEHRRIAPHQLDVAGRDIIVVQAKRGRLGMYLMGQALFSRELMRPFMPTSIRTVALCEKDDSVLRPLAEQYGIEVEIDDPRRTA